MSHRTAKGLRGCGVSHVSRGIALAAGVAITSAAAAQTYTWASAVSGSWGDAFNWTPSGVPGQGSVQSAVIDAVGSPYVVDYNVFGFQPLDTLSLASASAELRTFGQSLSTSGAMSVSAGLLRLRSGSLSIGGGLNIGTGGTIVVEHQAQIAGMLTQNGALRIVGGPSGLGLLSVGGFTNLGSMTLTSEGSAADARVAAEGLVTNALGASLTFAAGAGGSRRWEGALQNNGAVTIGADTVFDIGAATPATNNGTFTIEAGRTLTVGGVVFGPRFVQAGGTLNVQGAMEMNGGTFEYTGGTIAGTPVTLRNGAMLSLGASSGAGSFRLVGPTNAVTGDVRATQTVAVVAEDGGVSTATIDGINRGAVTISSNSINSAASATIAGNAAGGTISFLPGGAGVTAGGRTLGGSFTNFGAINVNANGRLDSGSAIDNRGTVQIASGATLEGRGAFAMNTGGSLLINGSFIFGQDSGFSAQTFTYNGGSITGSPVIRNATLAIGASSPAASFRIWGGSALSGDVKQGQTLTLEANPGGGSTSLAGSGSTNSGLVRLASTTVGQVALSGVWTNSSAGQIDIDQGFWPQGAALNGVLDNQGVMNVGSTLTLGSGATLRQRGVFTVNPSAPGNLSVNINQGATFILESLGTNISFGVPTQQRAINVSGVLDLRSGQLPSLNTVNVSSAGTFRVDRPGATTTMAFTGTNVSGLMDLRSDLTLQNNARIFLLGSGGIRGVPNPPGGTTTLRLTGAAFIDATSSASDIRDVLVDVGDGCAVYYGLGVAGLPPAVPMILRSGGELYIGNIGLGLLRAVNLRVAGTAIMDGSLGNGSSMLLRGDSTTDVARLTQIGGLSTVNSGVITFSGLSAFEEYEKLVAAPLINTGSILVDSSQIGSGARMSAILDNVGTTTIRRSFTLTSPGATHRNSGSIAIEGPATQFVVVGQSINNQPTGVISGTGTLNVRFSRLVNQGVVNVGRIIVADAPRSGGAGGDGSPSEFPTIGQLTIDGDADFGGSSRLVMEIAGRSQGIRYDYLKITGAAAVGGRLDVALRNFQPVWGDRFTLITAASLTGSFEIISAPELADPNLRWWKDVNASGVTLLARLVADTNRDNVVDFLDLNNVLSFFGQAAVGAARIGDANEDGVVDFLDLNAVLGFYGQTAPLAVPAPGAVAALTLGFGLLSRRRRG